MEQLIVRLGSQHDAPIQWLVWSTSEQEIIASGELPDASQLITLKERAGQRPIIALAPGSDILLKWVTLPPRAGRKVLTAIPYMLEDELAQDISTQFFALGPRKGDQQAVAVVAREKIEQWQHWLNDADLFCDKLVPDVLAVPHNEAGWSVLSIGDSLLVREDEWQGLQGETAWLLPAFTHILRQSETPVKVHNYAGIDLSHLPNVEIEDAELALPMHVLANGAINSTTNLYQGEYRIKRKQSGHWHQWRVAAILAAIVLVTSLVDKSVTLFQLKQENARLQSQIDTAVKRGFPNLGSYRDLRLKIRSEISRLDQGGSSRSMLAMMDALSSAFSVSQVKAQTLRFDAERAEIRMQAQGKTFESLEQFRRQAENMGFEVEQGAINNRDDTVIGTVAIRG
ncbi:type II secretion system protein GspL [Aestuariibacter sp. A3R04]|uniref:type II secretion system protein GspL n=1 Tax=Aestuariibacter sp. A3R04 TaxID=2841571 RepID=UPI001C088163|nr:type II secretion system protein GspL [Aestuariibacter sp. A3R04]MBU3020354.1 type II secretion system protein GspL [Aestuariibacter sp. A3R04]